MINRHKLLAVSFALVLIGTLLIQVYWIFSVVAIRTKQFDDAVFSAMHVTIQALDQDENAGFLSDVDSDQLIKDVIPKTGDHQNIQVKIDSHGTKQLNAYHYEYSLSSKSKGEKAKKNHSISRTIVISSDSMKLGQHSDSVAFGEKLSKIGVMIHKIAAHSYGGIQQLPDGKKVEDLLAKFLQQHNVNLTFSIGMKGHNAQTYKSKGADTASLFTSSYQADIFPNDFFKRDGKLFINFEDKTAYIFANMTWLLLIMLLFTLALLFMFYRTLSDFQKQKKLNVLKSDFINNMTHEFKTPLATIQVASDVILKQIGDENKQVSKMALTIKQQSKRIDEDVKNILQVAMLEHSNTDELNYSTFDLGEMLLESVKVFEILSDEKKLNIKLFFEPNLSIQADRNLLLKAVTNLLDNAVKYSAEGQEIEISARLKDKFVEIQVKDVGCGIFQEDLPHVFKRFYRAGKGNLHYNKGYGLGLNFVKKIAELHRGDVSLKSESGKGTEICIIIPQKQS